MMKKRASPRYWMFLAAPAALLVFVVMLSVFRSAFPTRAEEQSMLTGGAGVFSLVPVPSYDGRNLPRNQSVTFQITIERRHGETATPRFEFGAVGLPDGVTAAFHPAACNAPCASVLTLSAAADAPIGPRYFTVRAVSDEAETIQTFPSEVFVTVATALSGGDYTAEVTEFTLRPDGTGRLRARVCNIGTQALDDPTAQPVVHANRLGADTPSFSAFAFIPGLGVPPPPKCIDYAWVLGGSPGTDFHAGTHTVRIKADAFGHVTESNEGNNTASATATVPPAPDLVLRSVNVTKPSSTQIEVGVDVCNDGGYPNDTPFIVRLYFQDSQPTSSTPTGAGYDRTYGPLPADACEYQTFLLWSSGIGPPVWAFADWNNQILEVHETNNLASADF